MYNTIITWRSLSVETYPVLGVLYLSSDKKCDFYLCRTTGIRVIYLWQKRDNVHRVLANVMLAAVANIRLLGPCPGQWLAARMARPPGKLDEDKSLLRALWEPFSLMLVLCCHSLNTLSVLWALLSHPPRPDAPLSFLCASFRFFAFRSVPTECDSYRFFDLSLLIHLYRWLQEILLG